VHALRTLAYGLWLSGQTPDGDVLAEVYWRQIVYQFRTEAAEGWQWVRSWTRAIGWPS
jgi:hypothetical protein